ncbi:MAG: tryptophan-rich sensory protein [Oscillospiraceae bacterium]|nr:tryptophan-rich sensory protein [Oscillospiraceae bacterium]
MKLIPLTISILISLGLGFLSSVFSGNSFEIYKNLNLPALSPPPSLFPLVWTILFILMGISAYIIFNSKSEKKTMSIIIYFSQLILNFFWPIIFFKFENYFLSLIWIIVLLIFILIMIKNFYKIDKISGILQIPYFLWVVFAIYLNLGVYILNR